MCIMGRRFYFLFAMSRLGGWLLVACTRFKGILQLVQANIVPVPVPGLG